MIQVGIVGATGYVGQELVRLLSAHPNVSLKGLASKTYASQTFSDVYPNFFRIVEESCLDINVLKLAKEADVLFFALPHGITSHLVTDEVLQHTKVIDLGADFRFDNLDTYESWYVPHHAKTLQKRRVYGLHELHESSIKDSVLIGNPGCYTTASILALALELPALPLPSKPVM